MTTNPTSGQQFNGDGSLQNIQIILRSFDGSKKIDITKLLSSLTIYEDIFAPTLFGEINIIDSVDLMNGSLTVDQSIRFPIIGEEFLTISYQVVENDSLRPARNLEFFIYKISDVSINQTHTTRTYTLHLCSKENLQDAITIVQKAYSDSISNIVSAICKDYLKIGDTSNGKTAKTINKDYLENTAGTQALIIPALSPLEALQFLSKRAVAASDPNAPNFVSGSYLFFENFDGFNFCDVEYLILQGKKKYTKNGAGNYTYFMQDPKIADAEAQKFKTIIGSTQKHKFDTIEKLKMGYFESQVNVYDFINHKINTSNWDFQSNYQKSNAMGAADASGLSYPENTEAFIEFATTNAVKAPSSNTANSTPISLDTSNKFFKRFLIPKDLSTGTQDTFTDSIYPNRLSYFTRLNQQVWSVNTIGDPLIVAGDIINVNVPEVTGTDDKHSGEGLDKLTSGYYLIGSIQHKFTLTTYGTSMDLYKNAYGALVNSTDNTVVIPASSTDIQAQFNLPYDKTQTHTNQSILSRTFGF